MGQTQQGDNLTISIPGVLVVRSARHLHFINTRDYEEIRQSDWSLPCRHLIGSVVAVLVAGGIRIYDVATNRFLATLPIPPWRFSWLPDRSLAVTAEVSSSGRANLTLYQLHTNNWAHFTTSTMPFDYEESEEAAKARGEGNSCPLSVYANEVALPGQLVVGNQLIDLEKGCLLLRDSFLFKAHHPLDGRTILTYTNKLEDTRTNTSIGSIPLRRANSPVNYDFQFWPKAHPDLLVFSSLSKIVIFDIRKSCSIVEEIQTSSRFGLGSCCEIDENRFVISSSRGWCNWNGQLTHEHGIIEFWNYRTPKAEFAMPISSCGITYIPPFEDTTTLMGIVERTEKYFVPSEKVTRGKFIRAGGQGRVYRGTFQISSISSLEVAIKRFLVKRFYSNTAKKRKEMMMRAMMMKQREEEEEEEEEGEVEIDVGICSAEELQHEIELMTELNHENVLKCHGCFFDEDEVDPDVPTVNVILEWCSGGDLDRWLKRNHNKPQYCSPRHKVEFILQIVRGLKHIHDTGIIHSDLGLENVLVTSQEFNGEKRFIMKVSDFGLSNRTSSIVSTSDVGKPRYMPPSRVGEDKTKIDIYSLGILGWEIWMDGKHAYENELRDVIGAMNRLMQIRSRGLRPDLNRCKGMPQELKELLASCWEENPENRPRTEQIIAALEEIVQNPFVEEEEEEEEEGEEQERDEEQAVEQNRNVEEWTVEQVGDHLAKILSDESIKRLFVFNRIAGKDLGDLGMQSLRRMGVDDKQMRMAIVNEIDSLLDPDDDD